MSDAGDPSKGHAPVVILGGGLTGISAAVHLGELGLPWVLLEKEARVGGHARTDVKDGFSFDKTGHWLHLRDPYAKQLVADMLPEQMVRVGRIARIFANGALTRYPFQGNLHGQPPEVIKECLLGFLQRPEIGDPKDFEQYCLKHFGEGISRHFMIPYNHKLWGVHPREITSAWCSRFVPLPKLEDVVAGAVGAVPPELGYNVSFLYPREGGIETMTRALASRMAGGQVHLGAAPDKIDVANRTVEVGGERVRWRSIVASIPLPELMRRIVDLPPELERATELLRCTAVRYLNVALERSPKVDYHWIYVPEEKYPFYRVGVYTNAVPSMAPPGKGSLYVELSDRDAQQEAVMPGVLAGLREARLIERDSDVLFAEMREIRYAYVVFDHNYYQATATIFPWLERHGIYPRGRYGSWTYNAMEDCILAGREVARTIMESTKA
jgi:protoporphyrinogen oxidase